RTMKRSEEGVWLGESDNQITRVGWWLRKTNIDELPQALAIIKGDISLIGPRSDIKDLGRRLAGNIPFYHTRYFIRPGLTGWAQIKQSYNLDNISPQTVAENTVRLTYDLYYLKNRSLFLDLAVTLRTITALLSRLTKGLV
ncbi:MAG: sugar transferase, partial [Candidatus Paceibacterota bacterium]